MEEYDQGPTGAGDRTLLDPIFEDSATHFGQNGRYFVFNVSSELLQRLWLVGIDRNDLT